MSDDLLQEIADLDEAIADAIDNDLDDAYDRLTARREQLEKVASEDRRAAVTSTSERGRLTSLRSQISELTEQFDQTTDQVEKARLVQNLGLLKAEAQDLELALPFAGRSIETLTAELEDESVAAEELQERYAELKKHSLPGMNAARLARLEREMESNRHRRLNLEREVNRRNSMTALEKYQADHKARLLAEELQWAKLTYVNDLRNKVRTGLAAQWEVAKAEAEPIPPNVEAMVRQKVNKDADERLDAGRRMAIQNAIRRGRV